MTGNDTHACTVAVDTSVDGGTHTLRVTGHLDWSNVERLRAAVAEIPHEGGVVVDLRGARTDGAGTAELISIALEVSGRAQPLVFLADDPLEADVLLSVGIEEMAPVVATVEEAREALASAGASH